MKTVAELEAERTACTDEKTYDLLSKEIEAARKRDVIQAAREHEALTAETAAKRALKVAELGDMARRIENGYADLLTIDRELLEVTPRFLRLVEERVRSGFAVDGMHESALELARELGLPAPARKGEAIMGGSTVRPPWKTNPDVSTFARIWLQRCGDALEASPDGEIKQENISSGKRGSTGTADTITPGNGDF
jgi:hypothetical protein